MNEIDKKIKQDYVKTMIKNNNYFIIRSKDGSEKEAEKIADEEPAAMGVVRYMEDDQQMWGALIDKKLYQSSGEKSGNSQL